MEQQIRAMLMAQQMLLRPTNKQQSRLRCNSKTTLLYSNLKDRYQLLPHESAYMSHTVAKLSRGKGIIFEMTFFVWCVQKPSHRQHKSQKAAAKAKLRAALKEHVSWEPAEAGRMIRFTDQLDAFSGVSATQVQP